MTVLPPINSLYREIIIEHYKEPRGFGVMANADLSLEGYNPLCGDRITVYLKLSPSKDRVERLGFSGEGCSICIASASIMTEDVQGKTIEETRARIEHFRDIMKGEATPHLEGDIEALTGVSKFPVRIKCALLAWTTLKEALDGKT